MSIPCKAERSLLNHDEYEVVKTSHFPALHDADEAALQSTRLRLREMRSKERTLARHKRREARGKAASRGGSFPGTAERPARRAQVFANALKRINRELQRLRVLSARAELMSAAERALRMRRAGEAVHHPQAGRTAAHGMKPKETDRRRTKVPPAKVGSVSQAGKDAQAARDARP